MSNDNRPAILGIVEEALGGTGEEKKEMVGDDSVSKGEYRADGKETKSDVSSGKSTKAPGQTYSGSRKGPRKPVRATPPSRPPGRRP